MIAQIRNNAIKESKTVLLSVRPKFAMQILCGVKKVEFRRSWTRAEVNNIVIYATSPVQRILGIAFVEQVVEKPPVELWALAEQLGGGISKENLTEYFNGKSQGFGIVIKSVRKFEQPLDPQSIFLDFSPPQSYMFIAQAHYKALSSLLSPCQSTK